MKWILFAILGLIAAFGLGLAIRLGAFRDVQISTVELDKQFIIYKEHLGSYHKIVPVIEEVETWAKAHGESCQRSFGKYLDNPEIVDESRLRSQGGCVLVREISNMPPEYQVGEIPAGKYVQARFEGSPGIGPMKVYPRVRKFAEVQRIRLKDWVVEIYEVHGHDAMTTTYLFPMENF